MIENAYPDAELRRACAELDGHVSDGYYERFSAKLDRQLEREAMEHKGNADSPSTHELNQATHAEADEHSGLHEIKALASSARERIRRRTTESEFDESLLASSSGGMPAVVLPDPERSTPQMPLLTADEPELRFRGEARPNRSGRRLWLGLGGAVAAVVIAVLVIAFRNSGGPQQERMVVAESAVPGGAASNDQSMISPRKTENKLALPPSVNSVNEVIADDGTGKSRNGRDVIEGQTRAQINDRGDTPPIKRQLPKSPAPLRREHRAENKRRANHENKKALGTSAADNVQEGAGEQAAARAVPKEDDINAILDEVAGGLRLPEAEEDEAKAKPDKKALSSSDVKRAMRRVRGRVNQCGSKWGFTGKVSTRFSVAPNGRVTKVRVRGPNSAVNSCVKAAVKEARFPTFEPPVASFSFPFLMSD